MAEAKKKAEEPQPQQPDAKAENSSSGMRQNITGKQKAAMLLISIGPEKSAEIMRHLKEEYC